MTPVEKVEQEPKEDRLPAAVWSTAGPVRFDVAPEVVTAALSGEDIPDELTYEEVRKAIEDYKEAPANRG